MSERIMVERPEPNQGALPPVASPETPPATPEPAPAPAGETPPAPEPFPKEAQDRIDGLTRRFYEAKRLAEENERRAQQAEARLQQAPASQPQQIPYGAPGEREAEQRGYHKRAMEETIKTFDDRCNDLYARGKQEFGDSMDDAVRSMQAVGWGNPQHAEKLGMLLRMPDNHRVYRQLSSNMDNAARLLSMDIPDLALELARMSNGAAPAPQPQPAPPAQVSRAPEPLRPIAGNAARPNKTYSQMTTAEFIRERDRRDAGSSRIRR